MTPVLMGRWQTRVLMMATIGVIVSLAFFAGLRNRAPWLVLAYVTGFGIIWDVIFILLQKFRWDRDWPAAFAVATGVVEGALIYALIRATGLPGIARGSVSTGVFVAQYSLIWCLAFAWIEGPMRVFALFWRFHGGRLV